MRAFNNKPLYARRRRFASGNSLSITAPSAYFYLTSASPYDIGSTLQVADSEDAGGNYTVAITLAGGGTLTLSGTTGLTGSGDGTSSLSYSGTLSAINTALNGADIAGLSDETATMSITMTRDADSEETSRDVAVNAYPALAITTLAPADDATGVQPDAVLTATFNRSIQVGTGNVVLKAVGGSALETFNIATGTGDNGGTVSVAGAVLTITPGDFMTVNDDLAVQIASTAIDGSDIGTGDSYAGIADDTTWSFTTITLPSISTLDPLDNATGIPYNRRVYTATFNRAIQAGTGNVVLKLVGGAALETFDIATGVGDQGGDVTIVGNMLLLSPFADLTDNTAHAIQIDGTAIDGLYGASDSFAGIADDTTWSFTCEDTTPTLSAPLDSQTGGTTATAAVTTDRDDGTLWWVVTTSATTPSHAQIKAGQDHTGSAAAADGSQAVTATGSQGVSITGLTAETQYYTHFTQESANDAAATPVSADGFLTPDTTEPVLNSSVPADNATGVAVDSTIVLTFDENVILTTGGGNITIRKLDGSWTVVETFSRSTDTTGTGDNGGSISISGTVVTITPGADMDALTTHALRVAADCLENEAGHAYAGITDDTTLNWQTGIADTYAVEGFSPPVVADFENEYYRVGGSDSDFDSMLTYTSGDALSTQTDSDGLLKWCPHNLLAHSNAFNGNWTINGGNTVTFETGGSDPVGGTAEKITCTSVSGAHYIYKSTLSTVGDTRVSYSLFAKRSSGSTTDYDLQLRVYGVGNSVAYASFDVDGGSVSGTGGTGYVDSSIEAVGDFYLCTIVFENAGLTTGDGVGIFFTNNPSSENPTFTGNNTDAFDIYGAHVYRSDLGGMVDVPTDARVAAGSAFASYVPTTTAAKYLARRGNHVYNGTSWVNKGVLLETEARTNLITESNDFSTNWGGSGFTLSGTAEGPDGVSTSAQEINAGTGGTIHSIQDTNITLSAATKYVLSIFAKDVDGTYLVVSLRGSTSNYGSTEFDLTDGSTNRTSTSGTGWSVVSTGSVDYGGGWRRYYIEVLSGSTVSSSVAFIGMSDGISSFGASGRVSFSASNETILIYGAQLELGSTPSSYIPTSGATVTRPAQALSIAAANMSYSAGGVSWQVKGTMTYADNNQPREVSICQWGSGADELNMQVSTTSNRTGQFRTLGRTSAEGAYASDSANTLYSPGLNVEFNAALRHSASELNAAQDGTSLTASTVPNSVPNVSGQDFEFGVTDSTLTDTPLNITLFRQFDDDITDTGIETAST
jgi:hypothetical protein